MSTRENHTIARVVVIGGGIIGLSIAWRLARARCAVTVLDRSEAGREASWVAAGMVAPHSEVGFEEESFLHLGGESVRRFPAFLDDLASDSGRAIRLDTGRTLMVAFDRDDVERLRRLFDFRSQLGLPIQWLGGAEAREREPMLSPKVTAAISLPDDGQVNNREVVEALRAALAERGGQLREHTPAQAVVIEDNRVTGVHTHDGVESADAVVIAAGCWSNQIEGIPADLRPPVRPVKGQIIALQAGDCELNYIVRAPDVYLMRKDDGRFLIGATQEEMGFDKRPTAGALKTLLEKAWEAVPAIYDLAIESIDVGLRPGSRDNQPIIGESTISGLYYATGHFRHGVMLAPITADAIVASIVGGTAEPLAAPFSPTRFMSRSVR